MKRSTTIVDNVFGVHAIPLRFFSLQPLVLIIYIKRIHYIRIDTQYLLYRFNGFWSQKIKSHLFISHSRRITTSDYVAYKYREFFY